MVKSIVVFGLSLAAGYYAYAHFGVAAAVVAFVAVQVVGFIIASVFAPAKKWNNH